MRAELSIAQFPQTYLRLVRPTKTFPIARGELVSIYECARLSFSLCEVGNLKSVQIRGLHTILRQELPHSPTFGGQARRAHKKIENSKQRGNKLIRIHWRCLIPRTGAPYDWEKNSF